VIAIALIAGLQVRPQSLLPSTGTLQVSIVGDPLTSDPLSVTCHGSHGGQVQNLTSLVVTISLVQVHRTGALNLTGDWLNVTSSPRTLDLLRLSSLTQLGSISVADGVVNLVRLTVSPTATAGTNSGSVSVTVSSSHLDAQVNAQVTSGKVTSVTLEIIQPHVVCQGNGDFRLTPELTATSKTTG
jgi:Domain of unknown function (DUF4382)